MRKRLLIIIDPQNDFISGSLKVPDALEKMEMLAQDLSTLTSPGGLNEVVVTLDWHPSTHCSFEENGGSWPVHCISQTPGAGIYAPLADAIDGAIRQGIKFERILKGTLKDKEEYGAFDNPDNFIWDPEQIEEIHVAGIMSEFCVKESVRGLVEVIGIDPSKIYILLPYVSTGDNHASLKEYLGKVGIGSVDSVHNG